MNIFETKTKIILSVAIPTSVYIILNLLGAELIPPQKIPLTLLFATILMYYIGIGMLEDRL